MSMNYNAAVNINAEFNGQKAVDEARQSLSSLDGSVKGLANGFKFLAGSYVVKQFVDIAKSTIDLADHFNDLSKKTGIGVQALSDLKAAAEDNGLSLEGLDGSLKKFSVTVGKAQAGSREAQAGFLALGIALKDANGHFKSTDELLLEVADKFKNAADGPAKMAVAVALAGRSGGDLIPVLNEGREAIEGLGVKVSTDFAKQADQFNDSLNKMNRSGSQWATNILTDMLPTLNKITSAMGEFLDLMARTSKQRSQNNQFLDFRTGEIREMAPAQPTGPVYGPENKPGAAPGAGGETKKTGKIDTSYLANTAQLDREADAVKRLKAELASLKDATALERERIDLSTAAYQKKKIAVEENFQAAKTTANFKSAVEKKAYEETTQAIIAEKQALIDYQEQQKTSFGVGAKAAIKDYMEFARNNAAQTHLVFTRAFAGMEDALVTFVQTGKLSFNDLAKSIEADLIRIAIRKAIVFGIGSIAFGGGSDIGAGVSLSADGNVVGPGGPIPLRKYAKGGIARSPHFAIFGEGSTPEAFVPLPDGRNIPVKMEGGGGGGVSVSTTVIINQDGSSSSETRSSHEEGKQIGNMVNDMITARLIKEKRPGGILS